MIKVLCENCEAIFISKNKDEIICPTCREPLYLTCQLFDNHFIGHIIKSIITEGSIASEQESIIENYGIRTKINKVITFFFDLLYDVQDRGISILKELKPLSVHTMVGIAFFILGITLIGYNIFWVVNKTPYNVATADQDVLKSLNTYLGLDLPQLELNGPIRNEAFLNYNKKEVFEDFGSQSVIIGENETIIAPEGRVSSPFGYRRDPFSHKKTFHPGVDIPRPYGAKIKAAMSGKIKFSGAKGGYGKVIFIEHRTGYLTIYGHNSRNLVRVGDYVKQGQVIGYVGDTGKSTGPHLHFEVRKNGKLLDPSKYINLRK